MRLDAASSSSSPSSASLPQDAPPCNTAQRRTECTRSFFKFIRFFNFSCLVAIVRDCHRHGDTYLYHILVTKIRPPWVTGHMPASGHWRFRGTMLLFHPHSQHSTDIAVVHRRYQHTDTWSCENDAQQLGRGHRLRRATHFGNQFTNGDDHAIQPEPCGVAGQGRGRGRGRGRGMGRPRNNSVRRPRTLTPSSR